MGLSPRVRGNLLPPMYAVNHAGVYPRVCGGTREKIHVRDDNQGLSPRVRGNLHRQAQSTGR